MFFTSGGMTRAVIVLKLTRVSRQIEMIKGQLLLGNRLLLCKTKREGAR